jgi:hypothetical protein
MPSCTTANAQKQVHGHLPGTDWCCHWQSIKEFYFSGVYVFRKTVQSRLTLNYPFTVFVKNKHNIFNKRGQTPSHNWKSMDIKIYWS